MIMGANIFQTMQHITIWTNPNKTTNTLVNYRKKKKIKLFTTVGESERERERDLRIKVVHVDKIIK